MFKVQCSAFDVPGSGFEFILCVLGASRRARARRGRWWLSGCLSSFRTPHSEFRTSKMLHFRAKPPFFPLWTVDWRLWTEENLLKTLAKSVSIRVNPWLNCRPENMFKKTLKNI
jgi:hypothetical protein